MVSKCLVKVSSDCATVTHNILFWEPALSLSIQHLLLCHCCECSSAEHSIGIGVQNRLARSFHFVWMAERTATIQNKRVQLTFILFTQQKCRLLDDST